MAAPLPTRGAAIGGSTVDHTRAESSGPSAKFVASSADRDGLLDTPEFFWEYPELEDYYALTATYLDVRPRIEVLNKKLQVIHDMFDMLADERKHQHSSLLEWIIIWLIAIEIAIFLLHDLMGVI